MEMKDIAVTEADIEISFISPQTTKELPASLITTTTPTHLLLSETDTHSVLGDPPTKQDPSDSTTSKESIEQLEIRKSVSNLTIDTLNSLEAPNFKEPFENRKSSALHLTIDTSNSTEPSTAPDSPTAIDLPNMHLPHIDSSTLDSPRILDLPNAGDQPNLDPLDRPVSPTVDKPNTDSPDRPASPMADTPKAEPPPADTLLNITINASDSTCTASPQTPPTSGSDDTLNNPTSTPSTSTESTPTPSTSTQSTTPSTTVTTTSTSTSSTPIPPTTTPPVKDASDKLTTAAIKIQSVVRTWRAARFMRANVREHIFRTKAAFEIHRIERSYVSDLRILISQFCTPIKENSMLNAEEYATLFSNVETILPLHLKVLETMDAKSNDWSFSQTISDVFSPTMIHEFQELYEIYINNYEKSFELLRTLRSQRNDFKAFLQATECTQKCRGLDLTSFLVLPIQRFPRYIVMLKDLQRHTAQAHPEMKHTHAALEGLHSLTLYLNEAKRKQVNRDMVKRVTHIVSGISNDSFVTVDCQYLMEGILKRVKGKIFKEKKSIYAFLFKDMLIVAKQISEKKKPISMAHYRFSFLERISLDNVHGIRDSGSFLDGFHLELTQPTRSHRKDYLFLAGTADKRDVWMRALTENMRHTPSSSSAPSSPSSHVSSPSFHAK